MLEVTLKRLGIDRSRLRTAAAPGTLEAINPASGETLAHVTADDLSACDRAIQTAETAFRAWRNVPAPRRGELVRKLGLSLRDHECDLGALISLETGKIRSEGIGEVREMIDMCDFAVGLSRQLHGLTLATERSEHRLMEQWHPLGMIGVITAFNFPAAVWGWNAILAAVCGDSVVWKPSPLTPLTSLAVHAIACRAIEEFQAPPIFQLVLGDTALGERLTNDARLPLISATGSCGMGCKVAAAVGARLGRSLLELGGNNAAIIAPSADFELAIRAVAFAAVGTAGQRCTTLRRLIVHESIIDRFLARLADVYRRLPIGDPLHETTLVGPLIRKQAVERFTTAVARAQSEGAELIAGGRIVNRAGYFVEPTLLRTERVIPIMREETFAPILYAISYRTLEEAIAIQNDVEQGLSSAIFTLNMREAERFLAAGGSDCGIANVNLGTSGAEIGGAFGGEKATGGGREAGSDSWKAYMRRQTCTVNYGTALPLAQGVRFEIPEASSLSDKTIDPPSIMMPE